ncbi:unnamed protein product, partial [Allacma fusca]
MRPFIVLLAVVAVALAQKAQKAGPYSGSGKHAGAGQHAGVAYSSEEAPSHKAYSQHGGAYQGFSGAQHGGAA